MGHLFLRFNTHDAGGKRSHKRPVCCVGKDTLEDGLTHETVHCCTLNNIIKILHLYKNLYLFKSLLHGFSDQFLSSNIKLQDHNIYN